MSLKKKVGSGFATLAIAAGIAIAGAVPAQAAEVTWSGCRFYPEQVGAYIVGTTNVTCTQTQAVMKRFLVSTGTYSTYRSGWVGMSKSAFTENHTGYLTNRGNAINTSSNIYWF